MPLPPRSHGDGVHGSNALAVRQCQGHARLHLRSDPNEAVAMGGLAGPGCKWLYDGIMHCRHRQTRRPRVATVMTDVVQPQRAADFGVHGDDAVVGRTSSRLLFRTPARGNSALTFHNPLRNDCCPNAGPWRNEMATLPCTRCLRCSCGRLVEESRSSTSWQSNTK